MKHLQSKRGWEIVEEAWADFKGRIFKNRPKNLVELLDNTVRKYLEVTGFICRGERLTFGEFDRIVNRITAGLEACGIKKGDRVSLQLGIGLEFPLSFFALMKLGAIAVPLNTRFKGEELAYEINDSESKVLIVDEEYWPRIESVRTELNKIESIFFNGQGAPRGTRSFHELKAYREDKFQSIELEETDNALILYTSGTTGKPKGAILHHRGLIATAMEVCDFQLFEPEDKLLCCVPLFHVTGIAMLMLSHIFAGIPCVYMRTFGTKELLETISSEKITQMISVVNILWLMVNHPEFDKYDFSSFQKASCGGSPATEEMITGIMRKLPHLKLSPGYGLTESHGIESCIPWGEALRKINSIGKLLPLADAKIADEEGNELPSGEIGEILLKSPKITKGYWKNPEATRTAIMHGWLRTGDIGKFDDEGYLYLLDRKKDMINRGGEKVYSLEVENVISRLSKVMEVAVVGIPDHVMGEVVKAAIVLRPGEEATEEEIKAFCSNHLADYKTPKYVEFMGDLPRNPAGKVMKEKLKVIRQHSKLCEKEDSPPV